MGSKGKFVTTASHRRVNATGQELKPKREAWEIQAEAEKRRADEAEAKLKTIQEFFKWMPIKM